MADLYDDLNTASAPDEGAGEAGAAAVSAVQAQLKAAQAQARQHEQLVRTLPLRIAIIDILAGAMQVARARRGAPRAPRCQAFQLPQPARAPAGRRPAQKVRHA